jgi:hypothetical protein
MECIGALQCQTLRVYGIAREAPQMTDMRTRHNNPITLENGAETAETGHVQPDPQNASAVDTRETHTIRPTPFASGRSPLAAERLAAPSKVMPRLRRAMKTQESVDSFQHSQSSHHVTFLSQIFLVISCICQSSRTLSFNQ